MTKMINNRIVSKGKLSRIIGCVTIAGWTIISAAPVLAGTRYISEDGSLIVEYGSACSTVNPSGAYQVQNGVSGDLIATTCEGMGGDISEHRFTDTSGRERCYGRMRQYWGARIRTVWQIEGAVSGYSCSQTGKQFEIEMDSGQQI